MPYPAALGVRVVAGGPANASAAEVEAVLVALVQWSGATSLDVTDPSIDAPLAARLLACGAHWATVQARNESAVHELLAQGQHKIDRLELQLPQGSAMLAPDAVFLKMLMATGVKALVVHGLLDLLSLAASAQAGSALDGLRLAHIEACFVVPDDADVGWTIASLSRHHSVGDMLHKPMPLAVAGYTPLGAQAAQQLASRSTSARMARAAAEGAANRRFLAAESRRYDVSETWSEAVGTLGDLLARGRSMRALVQYVLSPANTLIPKGRWLAPGVAVPDSSSLQDKLRELLETGAPVALLRAALAEMLRGADDEAVERVCQALVLTRFPLNAQPPEAWQTLAQGFKPHRISNGVSPMALSEISAPPDSAPDAEPVRSEHASVALAIPRGHIAALVVPSGEASRTALLQRFVQMPRSAATAEVVRLLATGICDVADMDHMQQLAFTSLLLAQGQWKLLAHMVPARSHWALQAFTPEMAATLEKMAPWPSATSTCQIVTSSALAASCVRQLGTLATSVLPERLSVVIDIKPNGDAQVWESLAELVTSSGCRDLTLNESPDVAVPTDAVIGFLNSLAAEKLEHLALMGISDRTTPLSAALLGFVRRSAARALTISWCGDALTQAVVTSRPWNVLVATLTPSLVQVVRKGGVTARELCVMGTRPDHMPQIKGVVASTHGLKTLQIMGTPVELKTLAEILKAQPSIEGVNCALSMTSRKRADEGLALMRQNTAFRHIGNFEWVPAEEDQDASPLDRQTWDALVELTFRHALRYPKRFAVGAGSGFGASLGNGALLGLGDSPFFQRAARPFIDPGKTIGSLLDPRSAQALSLTSKAAYMASGQAWEAQIDALADLLAPDIGLDKVSAYLAVLARTVTLDETAGESVPSTDPAADLILEKVMGMAREGVPWSVLVEMIGHRLGKEGASTPRLLEALAFLGAMPSRQWLTEGLGIDLDSPPPLAESNT